MSPGQLHHRLGLGLRDGVVRPPAPVAMGLRDGSVPAVCGLESPGVVLAYSENLGSLCNGNPVFQNVVEDVESRLHSLIQCHIPYGWTFSLTS